MTRFGPWVLVTSGCTDADPAGAFPSDLVSVGSESGIEVPSATSSGDTIEGASTGPMSSDEDGGSDGGESGDSSGTTAGDTTSGGSVDPPEACASFDEIAAAGLGNAVYGDAEHYVAEFLYQRPNTCLWTVDESRQTVCTAPVPTAPADAIELPAPSGGDDTEALEAVINGNPGASFVGAGTYRVSQLDIDVACDIYDVNLEPAPGAGRLVRVNAADVRLYNVHADAKQQASVHTGFRLEPGATNFSLIGGSYTNMLHRESINGAGVKIRGARDYHIACNEFRDLLNDTDDKTKTARANSILVNGGNDHPSGGGYIVNNVAENHQSNGMLVDAEFFTSQSHTGSVGPIRIYANRCVNAGKRMTKWQSNDGIVLSNSYHWRDRQGPLGRRKQLNVISIQSRAERVVVRNNRFIAEGEGEWDAIFNIAPNAPLGGEGYHFDGNDIESREVPPESFYGLMVFGRSLNAPSGSGFEAVDSTVTNNYVHGDGSLSYWYRFSEGWANDGGPLDISGNVFDVPFEVAEFY